MLLTVYDQMELRAQKEPCLHCTKDPLQAERIESCCPYEDTIASGVMDALFKMEESHNFHTTMRNLQEPSTLSSLANWTFNTYGYDKKNFVLDGDLQIPIAIGGGRYGLHTFQVIPRLRFRIFQNDAGVPFGIAGDRSLPVRTPSAMPGVAYYGSVRSWWSNGDDLKGISSIFKDKFFGLYAYHHSNGQDGPELDTLHPGYINEYNGNFGEELIFEFILGGRKKFITEDLFLIDGSNSKKVRKENNVPGKRIFLKTSRRKELYWKLNYEWHPRSISNAVFDSLDMLPRHRINLFVSYHIIPRLWEHIGDGELWCSTSPETSYEKWRFTLNMNYAIDRDYYRGQTDQLEKINYFDLTKRMNIWLRSYFVIGRSRYASLFAEAGYHGSDNYNIYFNQSLWYFRAGLAFGFFDQPEDN